MTPSPAELDALTAWWLAHRHIGRAAVLLGRSRQTIANTLLTFRRLEGATDNVDLALKYLDEIERRKAGVLDRASGFVRFAAVERYPQRTGTLIPLHHNKVSELLESGIGWGTSPIPGRLSAVPSLAVSRRPLHRMAATESGEPFAHGITDPETSEAIGFHPLDLTEGQHRVRDELVVGEHREVIAGRHGASLLQVAA